MLCAVQSLAQPRSTHLIFSKGCSIKGYYVFHRDAVTEQQVTIVIFLEILFIASESIRACKLYVTVPLSNAFYLLHCKKIQLIMGLCYMTSPHDLSCSCVLCASNRCKLCISLSLLPPSISSVMLLMYFYVFFFLQYKNAPFWPSFDYDNTLSKG